MMEYTEWVLQGASEASPPACIIYCDSWLNLHNTIRTSQCNSARYAGSPIFSMLRNCYNIILQDIQYSVKDYSQNKIILYYVNE